MPRKISYCWNKSGYTVDMLNIIITTCLYLVSNRILLIPRCPTWPLAGDPSLSSTTSHYPGPESVLRFAAKIPGRCTPFCGVTDFEKYSFKKKKHHQRGECLKEKKRSSKLDILTCCCLQQLLHFLGNLLKNRGWNYRQHGLYCLTCFF